MNTTEKDVAVAASVIWRTLTAYTLAKDSSITPLEPWDPVAYNLRTNFRTLLRVFEWRYALIPFAVARVGYNIRYEEPGVFENVTGYEAFVFGIRVARWITKREWMQDIRYTAALAGKEQDGTDTETKIKIAEN